MEGVALSKRGLEGVPGSEWTQGGGVKSGALAGHIFFLVREAANKLFFVDARQLRPYPPRASLDFFLSFFLDF